MNKYLLFSYVPRFGGKGGMNDLVLRFDDISEIELAFINPPLDPMYGYVYQLLNTEDGTVEEYVSTSGYEREGEDRKKITNDRINELSKWLDDTLKNKELS